MSVLVVCLSPAFQSTYDFPSFNPNEVNRATSHTLHASGKGVNVSRVLSSIGLENRSLTILGGDRLDEYLGYCRSEGVDLIYVDTGKDIRTCTTVIDEEKHQSTELVEEAPDVSPDVEDKVMELYSSEISKHDAVVITGSVPKGFSLDIFADMTHIAAEKGRIVILDVRGELLKRALSEKPTIMKPNISEFMKTFYPEREVLEHDESDELFKLVEDKAREIYDEYGTRVIITRGDRSTWAYDGEKLLDVSIDEKFEGPVVNTIGCGDTFTSIFLFHLILGYSYEVSITRGMVAASKRAHRKDLL